MKLLDGKDGESGIVVLALALSLGTTSCQREPAPPYEASPTRTTAPAPSTAPANTAAPNTAAPPPSTTLPPPPAPPSPLPESVATALGAWNVATNAGDAKALAAAYAEKLSFYERIVTRAEAVRRKRDYLAKHPKFSQQVHAVTWQALGERRAVRFKKTWSSDGQAPKSVDAYLVLEQVDGVWRIVDEGDVETARKIASKLDAHRQNWKPRAWNCAGCDDPEYGDEPPVAGAPLGPDAVKVTARPPPGASAVIQYGRAYFPRFASAVDVPLFLTATPQSMNGDGRWFFYDDPRPGMQQLDAEGLPKHLLDCTIGGHFMVGPLPRNAKPDPGHVGKPLISYTTLFERREGELYFERYLYGADGVMNYVYCTFDPTYEAYFHGIVQRMGRSMRALGGGQPGRVERVSEPYRVD